MKINARSIIQSALVLLAALVLTACTTEEITPIPLPTAKVPSLLEVDGAITRWENSNNFSYFAAIEETNNEGTFLYRIVIADGEVRAAQRSEKIEGKWQQPVAIDAEIASNYTVDALLARVLRDAKGNGDAPLNMFTIFDSYSGFPSLVEAKAMPSYTEDGKMRLNRQFSYTISMTVEPLLEDTFSFTQTPLLTLNRSGGPTAACSTLRIFEDRSSVYSDDCRQILLQINPPENIFLQVESLAAAFSTVDEIRTDEDTTTLHIVLNGNGSTAADGEQVDELWSLATELNKLLSQPIGEGVTILAWTGNALLGIDMRTNLEQPAALDFRAPFYGGVTDNKGKQLIFADSSGLKWLDTVSGDTGTYGSNQIGKHYTPSGITSKGRIILQRHTDGETTVEWGWISEEDRAWHALPEEVTCITDVVENTVDERVLVISTPSTNCEADPGLWIVELINGEARQVFATGSVITAAAWSSDAETIALAFAPSGETDSVSNLALFHIADSRSDTLFETPGRILGLQFDVNNVNLYYGLSGVGESENGLYVYDLEGGETVDFLIGDQLIPLRFDPTGEFLAFRDGNNLGVWVVDFGRVIPITRNAPVEEPFVGWIDSTVNE